ncbi:Hypothetical predicted protein [Marmota monax]|uniref:Uncharacterized protein n=1 Tax=Marmota monax TaxID=9995 RepID=A0A5E4AUL6_MARMO|nr:Hypothetical predicted protein [Marmota monax]
MPHGLKKVEGAGTWIWVESTNALKCSSTLTLQVVSGKALIVLLRTISQSGPSNIKEEHLLASMSHMEESPHNLFLNSTVGRNPQMSNQLLDSEAQAQPRGDG